MSFRNAYISQAASLAICGLAVGAVCFIGGCDKATPSTAPASRPASAPTTTSAAVVPLDPDEDHAPAQPTAGGSNLRLATTAPAANAQMKIDQQRVEFPSARMILHDRDGKLTAVLFSDDPKEAINESYAGNAFYLEFPLEISDPAELGQATCHVVNASTERDESPHGIFLNGNKIALQAADVTVQFDQSEPALVVWLNGSFLQFEGDDANAKAVHVTAQLKPALKVKVSDRLPG